KLHRATDPRAFARSDPERRPYGRTSRRSAAVHTLWQGHSRHGRRPHPRGVAERLPCGEFFAGRRQQGYVGSCRRRTRRIPVSREIRPLLSRVADSVYWLARYIERAENVARFIGVNLHLQLDLPLEPAYQWRP